MTEWDDPNHQKEKLKVWKALVVWSDDETRLSDISRYFNMGNKKKAYQASRIRNIMASRDVWEFYGRPPKERENARDKNPKWEVSIVSSYSLGRSTQTLCFFIQFGSLDPNFVFGYAVCCS